MKIESKERLAEKILEVLQKKPVTKGSEILEEVQGSKPYFEQVMKVLTDNDLVSARRGPKGGYSINGTVSLWCVIKAFRPCLLVAPGKWALAVRGLRAEAAKVRFVSCTR
jgi:DNA-binding IscR family transcriptional regulator